MTKEQIEKILGTEFPPVFYRPSGGSTNASELKPWEEAAAEYRQKHSEVNEGGVKAINWDKDHIWKDGSEIYSIETERGQTLYPTPAPPAWEYLLVALFPILGFFIPWGAIRAIGWVGAGFVAGPK